MPLLTIFDLVRLPMWIILVPVSACWRWCVSATEWNSPTESSPFSTQLGYFHVIAEPASTCGQRICERAPRHSPGLVTERQMPPTPGSAPAAELGLVAHSTTV